MVNEYFNVRFSRLIEKSGKPNPTTRCPNIPAGHAALLDCGSWSIQQECQVGQLRRDQDILEI
jgi:hypothetical protein